jgi:hypothetical protein
MITIVSGLPRSGTSLMMQMLEKGGMPILTDHIRKSDESNPRGYYEFEKVKSLRKDASWMNEAEGKAVKVIAQLLYFLPSNYEYAVIFMERNLEEIVSSQQKMLERLGQTNNRANPDTLIKTFQKQVGQIKSWLSAQKNMRSLFMNYGEIMKDPIRTSQHIIHFLDLNLVKEKMASAVDPELYRQKS